MGPMIAVLLCPCLMMLASCAAPQDPTLDDTARDGAAPSASTGHATEAGAPEGADVSAGSAVEPGRAATTAEPPVETVNGAAGGTGDETIGGDGSPIRLEALTGAELETFDLSGELACSFADADDATLLLARADVLPDGPVRGAVNNNGYPELLGNGRAGGFDDLADGITLSGRGLTVVLERGERRPTGNEATQHAATLRVQRADGAERTYRGVLTCGP